MREKGEKQVLTGEQPDEDWLVNLRRLMAMASPPLTNRLPKGEKVGGFLAGVGSSSFLSDPHTPSAVWLFIFPSANPHTHAHRKRFSVEITGMSARRNDVTTSGPTFFPLCDLINDSSSIPGKGSTTTRCLHCCRHFDICGCKLFLLVEMNPKAGRK